MSPMATFQEILPLIIYVMVIFFFILPVATSTGIGFIQHRQSKLFVKACAGPVVKRFYPLVIVHMMSIIPITLFQSIGYEGDILNQGLLIHLNIGLLMANLYFLISRGIDFIAGPPPNKRSLIKRVDHEKKMKMRKRVNPAKRAIEKPSDSDAPEVNDYDEVAQESENESILTKTEEEEEKKEEPESELKKQKSTQKKTVRFAAEKRKKSNKFWKTLARLLKLLILSVDGLELLIFIMMRESKATTESLGNLSDAYMFMVVLSTQIVMLICLVAMYKCINDPFGALEDVSKAHIVEIALLVCSVLILFALIGTGKESLPEVCFFVWVLYTVLILAEAFCLQVNMFGFRAGLSEWVPRWLYILVKGKQKHREDIIKEAVETGKPTSGVLQSKNKRLDRCFADRNKCAGFIWHLQKNWYVLMSSLSVSLCLQWSEL